MGIHINWPNDEQGEPIAPVLLLQTGDRRVFSDAILTLESVGVPYLTKDLNGATFTKVLFGQGIGAGSIYVPEGELEDAKLLLETPFEAMGELPEELQE